MTARGARYIAKENGEYHYVSNKPCKKGHLALRVTSSGTCVECRKQADKLKYYADPEKTKAKTKKKYALNAENIKKKRKENYLKNIIVEREISKLRSRVWRKENPGLRNALSSTYRADKIKATPIFANLTRVKAIYQLAAMLNKNTDQKWHVDHIVPLRHPLVCGLHTYENLRVILASENMKKHNKFEVL